MKSLLGLIFLSVLLTPGNSLSCVTCATIGDSCTGTVERCGYGEDACASVWMQVTAEGTTIDTITKRCVAKAACADLKSGIERVLQQFAVPGAVVKKVECSSKAPKVSGSLLLAVSSLLLLKLLS